MKKTRIIALILAALLCVGVFSGCRKKDESPVPSDISKFRTVVYAETKVIRQEGALNADDFDSVTDVVLLGSAQFTEFGTVVCDEEAMNYALDNLYKAIGDRAINVYVNLTGPQTQSDSEDIEERRDDCASRHSIAFKTDTLADSIASFLEMHGFDGVILDYEYPNSSGAWSDFSKFIVKADKAIGDDKKLGIATSPDGIKISNKAIKAIDLLEVRIDSNDAEYENNIKKYLDAGVERCKFDLLAVPESAAEETKYAIENGAGGVSLRYDKAAFASDGSALKAVCDTVNSYK